MSKHSLFFKIKLISDLEIAHICYSFITHKTFTVIKIYKMCYKVGMTKYYFLEEILKLK